MLSFVEWSLVTVLMSAISLGYELTLSGLLTRLAGDAITWEALSVGSYIAGLGAGLGLMHRRIGDSYEDNLRIFVRVECWLALLGGASTILIQGWHMIYRVYFYTKPSWGQSVSTAQIYSFAVPVLGLIFVIGIFSGSELPLLIKLISLSKKKSIALVLALYHAGAFLATLGFSVLGLGLLGPHYGAILLGVFNAILAIALCSSSRDEFFKRRCYPALGFALVALFCLVPSVKNLEQISLKNFYYNKPFYVADKNQVRPDVVDQKRSWDEINALLAQAGDVERWYGPYQVIDLVKVWGQSFFIDGRFQASQQGSPEYHSTLGLPLLNNYVKNPESVLILGGGDGILAKLLLDRPGISELSLVEIDPLMLKLALRKTEFENLNGSSLKHPKLKIIKGDAFQMLKNPNLGLFDAVFVDFTFPFTFDSARFYGLEFFHLIATHLKPEGALAFATPFPYNETEARKLNLDKSDEMIGATLKLAGYNYAHLISGKSSNVLIAGLSPRDDKKWGTPGLRSRAIDLSQISLGYANSVIKPRFWGIPDDFL